MKHTLNEKLVKNNRFFSRLFKVIYGIELRSEETHLTSDQTELTNTHFLWKWIFVKNALNESNTKYRLKVYPVVF